MADRSSSRRFPLLLGLLALSGATVLLYIGSSLPLLVTGRALQGMAAAMVRTAGISLLVDTMGQAELGQALGLAAATMEAAVLLGPLLGGLIFDFAGYHAVFAVSFTLLGLDIMLRLVMIEKKVARKWTHTDGVAQYGTASMPQTQGHAAVSTTSTPTSSHLESAQHPNYVASGQSSQLSQLNGAKRRRPTTLWLLARPRVLSCLLTTVVQVSLLTSFDSVWVPSSY